VVSNVLSRSGSGLHLDLLTHYHPLTLPANAVYVFLLSIVVLSLLDRYMCVTYENTLMQQGCSQRVKWRAATLLSDLSFV
jgi:hypothetical protein